MKEEEECNSTFCNLNVIGSPSSNLISIFSSSKTSFLISRVLANLYPKSSDSSCSINSDFLTSAVLEFNIRINFLNNYITILSKCQVIFYFPFSNEKLKRQIFLPSLLYQIETNFIFLVMSSYPCGISSRYSISRSFQEQTRLLSKIGFSLNPFTSLLFTYSTSKSPPP